MNDVFDSTKYKQALLSPHGRRALEVVQSLTQGRVRSGISSGLQSKNTVPFTQFLRHVWPHVTSGEHQALILWARTREAQSIIQASSYFGSQQDLRRIFDLIDKNGNGTLSYDEVETSRIFSEEELSQISAKLASSEDDAAEAWRRVQIRRELSFTDFCYLADAHVILRSGEAVAY